jgi:hypothetical protein
MTEELEQKKGPNDYVVMHAAIDVLHRLDKLDTIVKLIEDIEDQIPTSTEGYDLLCYAYYKAKRYLKAIEYGEKALGSTVNPNQTASIRYNLGKCYQNANFTEKAIASYKLASLRDPNQVDLQIDLSAALYGNGQKDESESIIRKLLENEKDLSPINHTLIQFNLGVHELRKGNFKKGMYNLSLGRKLRVWGSYATNYPIPEWDGISHSGKSIMIVGEGGIGDELINARFIKHIKDMGMTAAFASCHNLSTILDRLPFSEVYNYKKFTTDVPHINEYDFWTPAMNLPKTLGIDSTELWYGPYLTTDEKYDEKWKDIIPKSDKLKIGIRWSGNPLYEHDLHRTIPVNELMKVLPKDAEVYSLQRDYGIEDLQDPSVVMLHDKLETFEDTMSAINQLDVVVSSCTSIAHAAAALGKRTIVLSPLMSYYIWAEPGEKSSWYGDNVTILKQSKPRSWEGVFERLSELINNI